MVQRLVAFVTLLAIESILYGCYSVLFLLSVHVLCTRKRAKYQLHLGCMISLYTLISVHLLLEYALVIMSDSGALNIYVIFQLDESGGTLLYGPDQVVLNRLVAALKTVFIVYTLSDPLYAFFPCLITDSLLADSIIMYRCCVIWKMDRRILVLLSIPFMCTIGKPEATDPNYSSLILQLQVASLY
ncbi:hypothetical protein C8J56DRAFT_1092340 [Mycena floridula]|nr:hypothetical protein C8J56DRAFT_1092340 [Mycena floridula]